MTPLRTLGGDNAEANSINNRGEVAGSTENNTTDSTCPGQTVRRKSSNLSPSSGERAISRNYHRQRRP